MDQYMPLAARDFGPEFEKFKITYGNALEYIGDSLYDTRPFVSTTTTQLPFFSGTQAEALTNLDLGNMLPDRQGFLVMSMRVNPFFPPSAVTPAAAFTPQQGPTRDMHALLTTGRLELNFLNKDYGTFPLWMLPAGGGIYSVQAVAEGVAPAIGLDYANNGIPDARNMYVIEQPLFLPPMTKIGAIMKWPVPLLLASGNISIQLVFDGLMVRPVQ